MESLSQKSLGETYTFKRCEIDSFFADECRNKIVNEVADAVVASHEYPVYLFLDRSPRESIECVFLNGFVDRVEQIGTCLVKRAAIYWAAKKLKEF